MKWATEASHLLQASGKIVGFIVAKTCDATVEGIMIIQPSCPRKYLNQPDHIQLGMVVSGRIHHNVATGKTVGYIESLQKCVHCSTMKLSNPNVPAMELSDLHQQVATYAAKSKSEQAAYILSLKAK